MFSTFKSRLLLGIYVFIILSIPIGAYLASQNQTIKSTAQEVKSKPPIVKASPSSTSSAKQLLGDVRNNLPDETLPSSPSPSSPTIATSFGPTLSFKANLEGRPLKDQSTRMFVGIVEGNLTTNPKFLLSFTVDLPASGEYSNLSLAGLSPGSNYTTLLKSSAQIATSSAFIMAPTVSRLNNNAPLTLLSGDLNDDNVINSADFSIAQKSLGQTGVADLNLDGIINAFDLSIIIKNLGQTGASGAWTSPLPKVATPSGGLTPPAGSESGHWIWVPSY